MGERICTLCGYEGRGKKQLRGSKGMEWFIWLTFVIPGPLYSFWRRNGVAELCPNCKRGSMVSPSSSEGYIVKKRLELELSATPRVKVDSPPQPPKFLSSNASGVSLTEPPAQPTKPKLTIDPDVW